MLRWRDERGLGRAPGAAHRLPLRAGPADVRRRDDRSRGRAGDAQAGVRRRARAGPGAAAARAVLAGPDFPRRAAAAGAAGLALADPLGRAPLRLPAGPRAGLGRLQVHRVPRARGPGHRRGSARRRGPGRAQRDARRSVRQLGRDPLGLPRLRAPHARPGAPRHVRAARQAALAGGAGRPVDRARLRLERDRAQGRDRGGADAVLPLLRPGALAGPALRVEEVAGEPAVIALLLAAAACLPARAATVKILAFDAAGRPLDRDGFLRALGRADGQTADLSRAPLWAEPVDPPGPPVRVALAQKGPMLTASWPGGPAVLRLVWPVREDGYSAVSADNGGHGFSDGAAVFLDEEIALTEYRLFKLSGQRRA